MTKTSLKLPDSQQMWKGVMSKRYPEFTSVGETSKCKMNLAPDTCAENEVKLWVGLKMQLKQWF